MEDNLRPVFLSVKEAILLRTIFAAFYDGSHVDEYLEDIKKETLLSFCQKILEAFPEMKRALPEYGTLAYFGHPTASLNDDVDVSSRPLLPPSSPEA